MIVLPAGGQQAQYNIEQSLRFRSSASPYLEHTPSSTGNSTKGTISCWVKLADARNDNYHYIFEQGTDVNNRVFLLTWQKGTAYPEKMMWGMTVSGTSYYIFTNKQFRDPTAWYHVVAVLDTGNATTADRLRLYINGERQTDLAFDNTSSITLNLNTKLNTTAKRRIGNQSYANANQMEGYIADFQIADNQALTADDFGEYDETYNTWRPKKYTGSYGTNGVHLDFADNTSTTTIGYDVSGNGHDFTSSGISLTSGYTYDWMKDVPLPVDEDTGNYATLHPLWKSSNSTTTDGNLRGQSTGGVNHSQMSSHTWQQGKWYFEIYDLNGSDSGLVGLQRFIDFTGSRPNSYRMDTTSQYGAGLYRNGEVYTSTGSTACTSSYTTGDVIMMAVDIDNDKVWWGVNGTWGNLGGAGVGDPAAGTNPHFTNIVSEYDGLMFVLSDGSSGSNYDFAVNFGQQPFNYTPPAGFKKWNSYNVEGNYTDAELVSGKDVFDVKTWTGNGTSQDITGLKFKPDLVMIKNLGVSRFWRVQDSIRGATGTDTMLYTNSNSNAANYTQAITSFNSDGVSLGTDVGVNESGQNFVGYFWKAGEGTSSSNTDGTITSTVSTCDVVTGISVSKYVGNGTAGATFGHGLNSSASYPPLSFIKDLDASVNWAIQHRNATSSFYIPMPLGQRTNDSTVWNGVNADATVMTLGTSSLTNTNTNSYIGYHWGFDGIKTYFYRGSGTDNGQTFVPLNFKPSMVWIKPRDNTTQWYVWDNGQNKNNPRNTFHYLDLTNTPNTSGADIDFLSNGFVIKNTAADDNTDNTIYLFVAFKDTHAKYALAG